jgi:hypothetical protein
MAARTAKKQREMIDTSSADQFWSDLNRTYSEQRYCDVDALPADLQATIMATEVEVERSSYTVGQASAFLRGAVTVDGESFDFEVSLGQVESEDDYDAEGEPAHEDLDARWQCTAEELASMSEAAGLTVYFTRA